MADASGEPAGTQQLGTERLSTARPGTAEAGATAAARQSRRELGLEIATWAMIGLNLVALAVLLVPGAAAVQLQEELEHQFDDTHVMSNAVQVYFVGVALCTVVCNGLAIWQRRSWGIAWAILAAVGCWIVFGVATEQAMA